MKSEWTWPSSCRAGFVAVLGWLRCAWGALAASVMIMLWTQGAWASSTDLASTDPLTLLRQAPRVQLRPDGTFVTPSGVVAPQDGLGPQPQAESSPSPSLPPSEASVKREERSRPAPPRSLLERLPLVGRILRSQRSSAGEASDESASAEPTPTPPVLLPPPSSDGEAARLSAPPARLPLDASTGGNRPGSAAAAERCEASPQPTPRASLIAPSPAAPSVPGPPSLPASELQPDFPTARRSPSASPLSGSQGPDEARRTSTPSLPHSLLTTRTVIVYPRVTNADLVPPSAEIEPNDAARNAYLQALAAAHANHHAEAARAFRAFAQRFPSSRLASRALFLAAILDPDPRSSAEAIDLLRNFFPRSDYLTELQFRGLVATPPAVPPAVPPTPAASPSDLRQVARLREEAEQLFRDKNYAAAIAKLQASPATTNTPDLLDLLAQCQIGIGDNVSAVATIEKILADFPHYEGRKNLRLTYGLILEDAGKYERAVAEYRKLIEEAPDSVEAQTARTRIQQLDQLTR